MFQFVFCRRKVHVSQFVSFHFFSEHFYLIFNFFILLYAFLDLKINDYILLNFILFIYLLFLTGPQGQQCYTLMGFSILYKNSLLLLLLLSKEVSKLNLFEAARCFIHMFL